MKYICEFTNNKILNNPDFLNHIFEYNLKEVVDYVINIMDLNNLKYVLWLSCSNGDPVIYDIEPDLFLRLVNLTKCYKEITSHSNVKKRNPLEKVFYKCNKIQQIKIRDIYLKLDFNSINKNDIFSSIFLNDIKI